MMRQNSNKMADTICGSVVVVFGHVAMFPDSVPTDVALRLGSTGLPKLIAWQERECAGAIAKTRP